MLTELAKAWILDLHMTRGLQVNDITFVLRPMVEILLYFVKFDNFWRAWLHWSIMLFGDALEPGHECISKHFVWQMLSHLIALANYEVCSTSK